MEPWIALTGFGAFVDVDRNPSGEIVRALAESPPPGVFARATVLPVSLGQAPGAMDAWMAEQGAAPAALLSLGVQRDPYFRIERRARVQLDSLKRDNDGHPGLGWRCDGDRDLTTTLELDPLARALERAGATDVRVSEDAGGFVCERVYHHGLRSGEAVGYPALFLHVPPSEIMDVAAQTEMVGALLGELWSAVTAE